MEAALLNKQLPSGHSLNEVISAFFKSHTPDSAKVLFWKLFQCWATKDCKIKTDVSDEEIALFFDQLIDLVAAAQILHQANRASNQPEGESHD